MVCNDEIDVTILADLTVMMVGAVHILVQIPEKYFKLNGLERINKLLFNAFSYVINFLLVSLTEFMNAMNNIVITLTSWQTRPFNLVHCRKHTLNSSYFSLKSRYKTQGYGITYLLYYTMHGLVEDSTLLYHLYGCL
jgi:hypothetical protein